MPLSDAKCRSAQPGNKLQKSTDGGGLQLWVQPNGARLWRFAYRFRGKQKLLALGVYPTIPLTRARKAREDARRLLAEGHDPAVEKKRQAQARTAAPTFRSIADEYVAKLKREDRSEATLAKTEWLLSFANVILHRFRGRFTLHGAVFVRPGPEFGSRGKNATGVGCRNPPCRRTGHAWPRCG